MSLKAFKGNDGQSDGFMYTKKRPATHDQGGVEGRRLSCISLHNHSVFFGSFEIPLVVAAATEHFRHKDFGSGTDCK